MGDDKGEGTGGRKCRSFQGRKMGDSANDFLVNLTSMQVGKSVERSFKAVPRDYLE